MSGLATAIATVADTRRLEEQAVAGGVSWAELMRRAGRGVADAILAHTPSIGSATILVLVGPGNNGGDALVVARHLCEAGAGVTLYVWKRAARPDDWPWQEAAERGIGVVRAEDDPQQTTLRRLAAESAVIVDGLLGVGVTRPLEPLLSAIVGAINATRAARRNHTPLVVAIDVPTGINADTGAIMGDAIIADLTVATGILKRGHILEPGHTRSGDIVVASIGLSLTKELTMAESLQTAAMRVLVPDRPADSHKGTFGKALVIAGAGRYPGAAFLTASGALRSGAGLVTLACGRSIFGALASTLHETTFLPLPEADWGVLGTDAAREIGENATGYKAWIVGPGLGREEQTKTFLARLLGMETSEITAGVGFFRAPAPAAPHAPERRPSGAGMGFRRVAASEQPEPSKAEEKKETVEQPPTVLDADGLYLLSQIDEWWTHLPEGRLVMTPHPGEMARLLKLDSATQINQDRVGAAQRAAQEWRQIVVLKGAGTVIAAPDGRVGIGPEGNAALATAGTGDVLAGVIGGLLAQGLDPFDAARLGVWLHAQAGLIVRREIGEAGAVAGDLLPRLPRAIRELRGA